MKAMSLRKMVVVFALISVLAGFAQADKLELQAKLSKEIKIQLKDVAIADALEQIGKKAGLDIVLSDMAAWKLPQGEATRLSVILDGPLAESLTEMLNVFFMRYVVGEEEVTIYPRPELEHILGRPTTKQLELLRKIYTRPVHAYFSEEVQRTINEALGENVLISPIGVHAQLNNLLGQLVGKDAIEYVVRQRGRAVIKVVKKAREPGPDESESSKYNLPTPVTLVQLLSQVVVVEDEPRYTRWYISGMDFPGQTPEIRVLGSDAFGSLKVNQKIDISYKDASLDRIFQDLANRAGVRLFIAPGSYLHEHRLSANMQNITIEQAIRNIADMAGAQCEVGGTVIQLSGPGKPKETSVAPRKTQTKSRGQDYVGKISIPMDGGKYYIEFMLRESDLTDELRKLRDEKMEQILGRQPEPKAAEPASPKPAAKPGRTPTRRSR